jgi:hypothetical protein
LEARGDGSGDGGDLALEGPLPNFGHGE